jgi:taurine dioxygenase
MRNTAFDIQPLSPSVGAELLGIDLSDTLSDATVQAIRQALLDHGVIFFRDQTLPPDKFVAFGRRFGELAEYPFVKGIEGFPEIIAVTKLEHEKVNFGGVWHSDTSYMERPALGSLLVAREVPQTGGDTLFANQYLAYESLSDGLRRLLDGLTAVNTSTKPDVSRAREERIKSDGTKTARTPLAAEHPVVRTHPETGRRALYINAAHTSHFVGMTEEESAPLLEFLFRHQIRPEFTCRFRWREGSVAFWDNRCVQHYPLNDYHGHRRVMHRITLQGDRPH